MASTSPDNDDNIPDINERLGYLRPSRELLEFYREKLAQFDDEHEELLGKLDRIHQTYKQQHDSELDVRQREDEIARLQRALSDLQVCLCQERDHVLKLYAENDKLKIQELEDRKRIQQLLSLNEGSQEEVTYFTKEPPSRAVVLSHQQQKQAQQQQRSRTTAADKPQKATNVGASKEQQKELRELRLRNETLSFELEAVQSQLVERVKHFKQQLEALLDDRRLKEQEFDARRKRDSDKLSLLTEKLKKTQDMLYESTRDFLELKSEHQRTERQWMVERDRLLTTLDALRTQINVTRPDVVLPDLEQSIVEVERQKNSEQNQFMQQRLNEAEKLAELYREQVIQLEAELARVQEQDSVGRHLFQERSGRMAERLQMMTQRYKELERRHRLQSEGFRNDVKILREKLKTVEKQLFKATLGMATEQPATARSAASLPLDDMDMAVLRDVKQAARRSGRMMGELRQLKSKIYGLENDLRTL